MSHFILLGISVLILLIYFSILNSYFHKIKKKQKEKFETCGNKNCLENNCNNCYECTEYRAKTKKR